MCDLMTNFERLRQTYMPDIRQLMDAVADQETPPGSSLPAMCGYHLDTGGKRLRALLPLAVAEAFGADPADVRAFGAACEMLHNATLVHDDLQDRDRARRGEQTVWVRYGESRAINLGDAMLYWSVLLVGRLDCGVRRREQLSQRLLRETLRVIDGQECEFLLKERAAPTVDDYFHMVEGKTSGLFSLPIAGAAVACDAPADVVDELEAAAGHLGVLFQIQDDLLDLYADKGREHRGTDICEGKVSALVVHFLEHAPDTQARWLADLLAAPRQQVDQADIDRAAELFREYGSYDYAIAEIDRRRRLACDTRFFADYPAVEALLDNMADLFLAPIAEVIAAN